MYIYIYIYFNMICKWGYHVSEDGLPVKNSTRALTSGTATCALHEVTQFGRSQRDLGFLGHISIVNRGYKPASTWGLLQTHQFPRTMNQVSSLAGFLFSSGPLYIGPWAPASPAMPIVRTGSLARLTTWKRPWLAVRLTVSWNLAWDLIGKRWDFIIQ